MVLAKENYNLAPEKYYRKVRKRTVKQSANKGKKTNTKVKALAVCSVLFAFALGIILTAQYAKIAGAGYEIVKLKSEIERLETSNQRLNLEVVQLQSLDRIEQVAKSQLGMVPANSEEFKMVARKDVYQGSAAKLAEGEKETPVTSFVFEKENHKLNPFIQAITKIFIN